jgi:hypothetical protein
MVRTMEIVISFPPLVKERPMLIYALGI